jgi:hypothetical protein
MNMHGLGCALYIRCALSIHQKERRKGLGCALYIRCALSIHQRERRKGLGCALSIHQKERRKGLGCALYIGARYIPENRCMFMSRDRNTGQSHGVKTDNRSVEKVE